MALFVMTKRSRAPKARMAPSMKRQSRMMRIIRIGVIGPSMKSRLPSKTMEAAVTIEKIIDQKITPDIISIGRIIFLYRQQVRTHSEYLFARAGQRSTGRFEKTM